MRRSTRKLLSLLLLAVCLFAAPIRAYASDVVELEDTPPMEEDAGSDGQLDSPATSEPSEESKDKANEAAVSGASGTGAGNGQSESPATSKPIAVSSEKAAEAPAPGAVSPQAAEGKNDSPATHGPSAEATEAPAPDVESQSSGEGHVYTLWIGLLLIALLALSTVCVFGKRKRK